jgi:light-harvesting protein B-800-850 beta chain
MASDPDKVFPTGLTIRQAEELHDYLINGTRVFFMISVLAHVLAYILTPWMK